jgi:hypothetical protein
MGVWNPEHPAGSLAFASDLSKDFSTYGSLADLSSDGLESLDLKQFDFDSFVLPGSSQLDELSASFDEPVESDGAESHQEPSVLELTAADLSTPPTQPEAFADSDMNRAESLVSSDGGGVAGLPALPGSFPAIVTTGVNQPGPGASGAASSGAVTTGGMTVPFVPTVQASEKPTRSARQAAVKTEQLDLLSPIGFVKRGKRKQVDLESISDIEERRKQKRLAKNRATAALSRERKRTLMQSLQAKLKQLDQENNSLKYVVSCKDIEIARLQEELAQRSGHTTGVSTTSVPAVSAALKGDPTLPGRMVPVSNLGFGGASGYNCNTAAAPAYAQPARGMSTRRVRAQ